MFLGISAIVMGVVGMVFLRKRGARKRAQVAAAQ